MILTRALLQWLEMVPIIQVTISLNIPINEEVDTWMNIVIVGFKPKACKICLAECQIWASSLLHKLPVVKETDMINRSITGSSCEGVCFCQYVITFHKTHWSQYWLWGSIGTDLCSTCAGRLHLLCWLDEEAELYNWWSELHTQFRLSTTKPVCSPATSKITSLLNVPTLGKGMDC